MKQNERYNNKKRIKLLKYRYYRECSCWYNMDGYNGIENEVFEYYVSNVYYSNNGARSNCENGSNLGFELNVGAKDKIY